MNPFTYICNVEKICKHIEILLAQNDYVVVPNLGGFVVQQKNTEILSDRINPPLATIGFNPLLSQSDGLLAIEIAKSEGLSYRLAVEFLENEVKKIKVELSASGKVQLDNLGQLNLNQTGNIIFSPLLKSDFLPTNFGLKEIYVSEIDILTKSEIEKITFTLSKGRFYKYAAACLLIFSLMFLTPKISDKRQINSADLLSAIDLKPSVKSFKQTHNAIIYTSKVTASIPTASDSITKEDYHVIVASLSTEKTAEVFCKELVNENFTQAHILSPVKTYRIAIKSFSDLDDAIQYMENLRKTDKRFETAWVLCDN